MGAGFSIGVGAGRGVGIGVVVVGVGEGLGWVEGLVRLLLGLLSFLVCGVLVVGIAIVERIDSEEELSLISVGRL